jgi:hypothetical protein
VRNLRANPRGTVELGDQSRVGLGRVHQPGTAEDHLSRDLLVSKYADDLERWGRSSLPVGQMREQMAPQALDDGLRARFPGQIADNSTLSKPLDTGRFELGGFPIYGIETGHTDGRDTTSLHVPDIGLIVSATMLIPLPHVRRRDDRRQPG